MMEEGYNKSKADLRDNDIVFSKTIKAGKRIYYLDVKKNKKEELFLAITESKKIVSEDQTQPVQFEKHKIFLYKEDFDKFEDALEETLNFIRQNNTVNFVPQRFNEEIESIDEEIKLKIDF